MTTTWSSSELSPWDVVYRSRVAKSKATKPAPVTVDAHSAWGIAYAKRQAEAAAYKAAKS